MALEQEFAAKVIAQLAVERAFSGGRLGAFIEGIPSIDTQALVTAVAAAAPSPVRVAILGSTRRPIHRSSKITVTLDSTEANRWRNDKEARGGVPSIFVVVGPDSKLNSLRTAVPIVTTGQLRTAVTQRAMGILESPERRAFYKAIEERTAEISTPALLGYVAVISSAAERSRAQLLDVEPREVARLGLLPSDSLFGAGGIASARRAVRRNLDLVRSLRSLASRTRESLAHLSETESDLGKCAGAILRFERNGKLADLAVNTLEEIEEAIKTKSREDDSGTPSPRPKSGGERLDGDALALDLVLNSEGHGLGVAAKRFKNAIEPSDDGEIEADEVTVGHRTVTPRVKVGTAQSTALFGKLVTSDTWGGLISAPDATEFVAALKLVASGDADVEEFKPGSDRSVRWTLKRAADQGIASSTAVEHWDRYAAARSALLPFVSQLIDHPLLAMAGDGRLFERAKALLAAYATALESIQKTAAALEGLGSVEASKRLLATTLALDVAFVRSNSEFVALAAPTHPFHLWRWTTLLEVIQQHKTELGDIGQDALEPLVTDPPAVCPQLVLSPFAVARGLDRARPFIPSGSFGALPQFVEPTSRSSGKFRARALSQIAQRLVRLMPHASFGLRIMLVDPPSVAGALEDLLEMISSFDEEVTIPIHAVVARTALPRDTTDEEEDEVTTLARDLTDRGGTLTVLAGSTTLQDLPGVIAAHPTHIAVVFNPGTGDAVRIGLAAPPPLSPLAAPRAYRYDAFDDRLDVVVAGDTAPFGLYHDLFCKSLDIPRTDFVGRRSGASQHSRHLEVLARHAIWTVVIDQAVEPTLRLAGAERLDWRNDSGRDVVTFTAHTETIEELMADALRSVGLSSDEESRKGMLQQLFLLSGEAVLSIARARPGTSLADPRTSRAIVGVLAANRWYARTYTESIVISLDDPTSRRWVLGVASDDRHGDLLAVRSSASGIVLEVIEVKAHGAEEAGVTYRSGILEGKAITQIDQTIATLKSLLVTGGDSPVSRARRDILRDQLYRAVASRPYSADQRARYVGLLQEFFERGPHEIRGALVRVTIDAGAGTISPVAPKAARTPAGNVVLDVELIEGGSAPQRRSTPDVSVNIPAPAASIVAQVAKYGSGTVRVRGGSFAEASEPEQPASLSVQHATGVRILIGSTSAGSEIYWDPHRSDAPLNNFGFLITGDPGSGKTQIIKAILAGVVERKLPVCIFDFKNDYADIDFAKRLGLRVYDIDREGLPFNPLALVGDDRGEVQPIRQIHELTGILRRIFGLGDQQEARLKRAMSAAYEARGIRPDARKSLASLPEPPDFAEVKAVLDSDTRNEALLNRLSPLFDLDLFPSGSSASTTFESLMNDRVVLDLHRLPTDSIKQAMSEFIIVRLHSYMLKGEQPRELRRLLVFDEAWRVKESVRLQELAREGRAFGVGITVGTQFPGDIPETLAGNLSTQLLLANQDPEHRKTVVRTLCGATSGPTAQQLMSQVAHLQKHEGFFRNAQYAPYALATTLPFYKR